MHPTPVSYKHKPTKLITKTYYQPLLPTPITNPI